MILGAVLLVWMLGSTRGLLGTAVGGFVGALAAAGMVTATTEGELASMYGPVELAGGVLPLGLVALLLAVALPYVTGTVALAWTAGALLAAIAAPRTGQTIYLAPLLLHACVAAGIARVAAQRMTWD